MLLPHITYSLSGPPRLPLRVSTSCFTSGFSTHHQAANAYRPLSLSPFMPQHAGDGRNSQPTNSSSRKPPRCRPRPHQRYGPALHPCFAPSIVAYVSMSLFCSPDTQLLQGLGLSNSSLVPRVCLGTQQQVRMCVPGELTE